MKLLLIDDHALLRDSMALAMTQEFIGLELRQASTLAEAEAVLAREPDTRLIVFDLTLPDGDAINALPRLREAAPAATLVALSADVARGTVMAAIGAGAAGYITKTADAGAMLAALHVVLAGGVCLPPSVLERRAPDRPGYGTWTPTPRRPEELGFSPHQADVLRLLIEGKAKKLISRDLDMSDSTVETLLASIFRKLDATSRTQAVLAAARLGLRFGDVTRRSGLR
jgi:DNA-binding NarL/FixJ family response regulator